MNFVLAEFFLMRDLFKVFDNKKQVIKT